MTVVKSDTPDFPGMESVEVVLDDALAVEIQVEEAPVEDDVVVALKNYCRLNLMSFIME